MDGEEGGNMDIYRQQLVVFRHVGIPKPRKYLEISSSALRARWAYLVEIYLYSCPVIHGRRPLTFAC